MVFKYTTDLPVEMTHKELEGILNSFPSQWGDGFSRGKSAALGNLRRKKFGAVLVCGMGGSALPGKLLHALSFFQRLPFAVRIWGTYGLPLSVQKNSLVVCISYSGNTEETISSFQEARKKRLPTFVIATGGKLIRYARRTRTPFLRIPETLAPRFAVGYLFGGLAGALSRLRLLRISSHEFERASQHVSPHALEREADGLARALQKKIPLVYTQEEWQALGHIWKISFEETAKTPAFHYTIPELNHNEMEALVAARGFHKIFAPIFLEDPHASARLKKHFRLTKSIFKKEAGLQSLVISISGTSFLEKAIAQSLLAYWATYFLATRRGVHPIETLVIEKFKRLMG